MSQDLSMEYKKSVYLFLILYFKQNSSSILNAMELFLRDSKDSNPYIRGG
jgi:vesicle coat complex subunit